MLPLTKAALGAIALAAAITPPAHALSVSYIDNGQVWVASADGAQKRQLSTTFQDQVWLDAAQSDDGHVVGVRNKPGNIPNTSGFQLWNPDGSSANVGPLTADSSNGSYAYPLSLDLTADAKHIVYGYSQYIYGYPVGTLNKGTFLLPSNTQALNPPFKISGELWPTVAPGNRLLTSNSQENGVDAQNATGAQPYTNPSDFTPWLNTAAAGLDTNRTDMAANGKVMGIEFEKYETGSGNILERKIALFATDGPGGTYDDPHSCFLPASGFPFDITFSQDGTKMAWQDDGGIKVAGIPNFPAVPTDQVVDCPLTSPPVIVSATGKNPSLGPMSLPAPAPPVTSTPTPPATTQPAPGTGMTQTTPGSTPPPPTTPTATVAPSAKASQLATGLTVSVTAPAAGTVKLTLVYKGTTIATGTGKARKAGKLQVKLKATKAGKKKLKALKGKKATLRIQVGTKRSTKVITLK